jgi:hypothetical protein
MRYVRGSEFLDNKSAHKRYLIVDPYDIAAKLERLGATTKVIVLGRKGHRVAVEASMPQLHSDGYPDSEYKSLVSILLTNDGRSAIRIQPGALRLACENQFYAAPHRIHHCSDLARDFLRDPTGVIQDFFGQSRQITDKLELLEFAPAAGFHLLRSLQQIKPRLAKAVGKDFHIYRGKHPGKSTTWSFLQALTAGHNRSLGNLATWLLETRYEDLSKGQLVWPEEMKEGFKALASYN